jgi:hypothetical protein
VELGEYLLDIRLRYDIVQCGDSRLAEKGLNAQVAEGKVGESFQQVDKVLAVLLLEGTGVFGMRNEGLYHALCALRRYNALATVVINTQLLEGKGNCFPHLKHFILKELLQHGERIAKEFTGSPLKCKA